MRAALRSASKARLVAAAVAALSVAACGTSIQAVYEGDVRFEHCMALDARTDVKPTIRHACWEEWEKFYTFGQTRDRVEYASLRKQQLGIVSDFDEGEWTPAKGKGASAAPDPTTAFAPPPMMLTTDASATPDAGPAPDSSASAGKPASSECAASCEDARKLCAEQCRSSVCEKGCASGFKRCSKRCP